jgi:hypothetical protein
VTRVDLVDGVDLGTEVNGIVEANLDLNLRSSAVGFVFAFIRVHSRFVFVLFVPFCGYSVLGLRSVLNSSPLAFYAGILDGGDNGLADL